MPFCNDGWEWWGGAPTIPPLYTQTQMSRLISLYPCSKEIHPSTTVITPRKTHTSTPARPPSFPFEITLPVSSFSAEECIGVDETEWKM